MAEFKVVIGMKSGKAVQREVKGEHAKALLGKKIGDKISGDAVGFAGYEFELTGGSDYCGFPMRRDVQGTARKRILAIYGTGLKKKGKGIRQRKTVAGNTVHSKISQINLKVLKEGKEKLDAPAKEAKEGEAPAEGEKKEAPKSEEKPAEKKEEPKAEKKEAPKEEKKEEKPAEKKEAPKEEKKKEPKPEEKKE
jgi:small subunit ribosomal protein S6e